jgi:hypothetical protein
VAGASVTGATIIATPSGQVPILFGFQLGQFVPRYADCFEVLSIGTRSNRILWRSSRLIVSSNSLEILKMMDWIPVVLVTFKALVLGTGMFFAIKWHYDQDKKEKRAVLHAVGKIAAVFVVLLLGLVLLTFFVSTKLGLDLTFP